MILTGIDCQIPSRKISNENIIELVKYNSSSISGSKMHELEVLIEKIMKRTGIESRFWRKKNEKPLDLILHSVDNALKMSDLNRNEIDLVIFSSIDRGFIEPSNASIICKAIGLDKVRNFDIVDACMGWASAVQVANAFFISSPSIKSILIVNAEFPMDSKGSVIPHNFTINDKKELKWKSASFTLGEAASSCIFQRSALMDCKFEFIENSQNAELCTIPLPNFEKYVDVVGENMNISDLDFYAHSSILLHKGINPAIEVLQRLLNRLQYTPEIIFPHSVSDRIIKDASRSAGVQSKIYSTFSKLGNLATVSVPSSIHSALHNNIISKNKKGIAWIASAGMKYSAFEIQL